MFFDYVRFFLSLLLLLLLSSSSLCFYFPKTTEIFVHVFLSRCQFYECSTSSGESLSNVNKYRNQLKLFSGRLVLQTEFDFVQTAGCKEICRHTCIRNAPPNAQTNRHNQEGKIVYLFDCERQCCCCSWCRGLSIDNNLKKKHLRILAGKYFEANWSELKSRKSNHQHVNFSKFLAACCFSFSLSLIGAVCDLNIFWIQMLTIIHTDIEIIVFGLCAAKHTQNHR